MTTEPSSRTGDEQAGEPVRSRRRRPGAAKATKHERGFPANEAADPIAGPQRRTASGHADPAMAAPQDPSAAANPEQPAMPPSDMILPSLNDEAAQQLLVAMLLRALTDPASTESANGLPTQRANEAPRNEQDVFDRHEMRATENAERAGLYERRSKDRRRDERHRVMLWLIVLVLALALYVAGVVVLSSTLPGISPGDAAKIIGYGYAGVTVSGGGFRAAWRVWRRRNSTPKDI